MPNMPTQEELLNHGRNEIQARGNLNDFTEGSNLDAVNGGAGVQADEVLGVVAQKFGDLFFDTASGPALDTLVLDRFGSNLARKSEVAAVGTLTFSTIAALVPAGTRVEATIDGELITVVTDSNAVKLAGPGTVDVTATALQTGRQGNITAGLAVTILDPVPGDAAATVTNAERFAGGSEEETDEALRDRAKAYFQSLRGCTISGLITGALTVPGVSFVTVDESTVGTSGWVSVYVGDPDGAGNTVLAEAVEAELINWRAAGVDVQAFAAAREEISIAITVTVLQGSNLTELRASIEAAVLAGYMDNLASNAIWYASKVESQVHGVDRTQIRGVDVTNPATITLAPSLPQNALRTLLSALTISWVEV